MEADDVGVREQLERGDLAAYLVVDALRHDAGAVQDLDGELGAAAAVPRLLHLPEVALPERPPELVRAQQPARAAAHHLRRPAGRDRSIGAASANLASSPGFLDLDTSFQWLATVWSVSWSLGWNGIQGNLPRRAPGGAEVEEDWRREGGEGDRETDPIIFIAPAAVVLAPLLFFVFLFSIRSTCAVAQCAPDTHVYLPMPCLSLC